MGIKAFNHGDDFVNKFVRAIVSDSTGLDATSPVVIPDPNPGIQATGGIINDWTDPSPGDIYRAHVFTSSGAFNVTALSTNPSLPDNVDILVVAGGGGGGGGNFPGSAGGGGGAGGLRYLPNQTVTANRFLRVDIDPNETTFFETTYPIVMTDRDSLSVEITAPEAGGSGIGSAVNFIVNGDTDV